MALELFPIWALSVSIPFLLGSGFSIWGLILLLSKKKATTQIAIGVLLILIAFGILAILNMLDAGSAPLAA